MVEKNLSSHFRGCEKSVECNSDVSDLHNFFALTVATARNVTIRTDVSPGKKIILQRSFFLFFPFLQMRKTHVFF